MSQFIHRLHSKMPFKHSRSFFAQHMIVPHGLSKLFLSRTSTNFEPVLFIEPSGKSTRSAVIPINGIFHPQTALKSFVDNVDSLHTAINVTPAVHSQVPPLLCLIRPLLRTEEAWRQCHWLTTSPFFSCTCWGVMTFLPRLFFTLHQLSFV